MTEEKGWYKRMAENEERQEQQQHRCNSVRAIAEERESSVRAKVRRRLGACRQSMIYYYFLIPPLNCAVPQAGGGFRSSFTLLETKTFRKGIAHTVRFRTRQHS